jgi:hypothetical protein
MNMFKQDTPSKPQAPTAPPPPPTVADAADSAQQRGKIRKGEGYSSTILTGGQGDTSEAPTFKKTLLGS